MSLENNLLQFCSVVAKRARHRLLEGPSAGGSLGLSHLTCRPIVPTGFPSLPQGHDCSTPLSGLDILTQVPGQRYPVVHQTFLTLILNTLTYEAGHQEITTQLYSHKRKHESLLKHLSIQVKIAGVPPPHLTEYYLNDRLQYLAN